jgi:DTW domain-containing protein
LRPVESERGGDTCVCAELPIVRVQTPIAIVQHVREQHKPTNTARLFARIVEGTEILPYGMREPPFDPSPLVRPDVEWRVLFPREGTPVVDPSEPPPPGKRFGYVVVDGTWHQCSRMSKRAEMVRDMPCVALPPAPPSIWAVRKQHLENGMCTFEAALHLLEVVESREALAPVRDAFAMVVAKLLFMKGKLASPEVPAEWRG